MKTRCNLDDIDRGDKKYLDIIVVRSKIKRNKKISYIFESFKKLWEWRVNMAAG